MLGPIAHAKPYAALIRKYNRAANHSEAKERSLKKLYVFTVCSLLFILSPLVSMTLQGESSFVNITPSSPETQGQEASSCSRICDESGQDGL